MSKFKVGDRVLLREDSSFVEDDFPEYANPLGVQGTINRNNLREGLYIRVVWDNGEINSYTDIDLDRATIPDSKLARNLYKNKIDKIEDGKIYLK